MSATNQSDMRAAFESEYTKRYGHSSKNVPVDLVNLRVVVTGVADKPSMNDVEAGDRASPRKPAKSISTEKTSFLARFGRAKS